MVRVPGQRKAAHPMAPKKQRVKEGAGERDRVFCLVHTLSDLPLQGRLYLLTAN